MGFDTAQPRHAGHSASRGRRGSRTPDLSPHALWRCVKQRSRAFFTRGRLHVRRSMPLFVAPVIDHCHEDLLLGSALSRRPSRVRYGQLCCAKRPFVGPVGRLAARREVGVSTRPSANPMPNNVYTSAGRNAHSRAHCRRRHVQILLEPVLRVRVVVVPSNLVVAR